MTQIRNPDGSVSYDPYQWVSPYFAMLKGANGILMDDAEWLQPRAGRCIGDVMYDFRNKRSILLGTIYNDSGKRIVKNQILNEGYRQKHGIAGGHHTVHPANMPSFQLLYINEKGVYTIGRIGATPLHFVPEIKGAFVFDPIVDLVEDLGYKEVTGDHQGSIFKIIIPNGSADKASGIKIQPQALQVQVGDIVEFMNNESVATHVIASGDIMNWKSLAKEFLSPMIRPNGVFRWQARKEGMTYQFSSVAYSHIRGSITVTAAQQVQLKPKPKEGHDEAYYVHLFKRLGWPLGKIRQWLKKRRRNP